jgi:hypothetical protein
LTRALRGAASDQEIVQLRCVDGSTKPAFVSASPLFGLDKKVVGAVVVVQDIYETKQIATELERRITRLVAIGVEIEQSTHH